MKYRIIKITRFSGKAHYIVEFEDEESEDWIPFKWSEYGYLSGTTREYSTIKEAEEAVQRDKDFHESVRLSQIISTEIVKEYP
jgi:hypothetical protein